MPLASRKEMEARYGQMVAEKQAQDQEMARQAMESVSGVGTGLMNQARSIYDLGRQGANFASNYLNDIAMMRDPTRNLPGYTELSEIGGKLADPETYKAILQDYRQRASTPRGFGEIVGENINPLRVISALRGLTKPVMSEINVYHGSPHKFDAFDADKIGTGEGAQAYGHGIYLAESPNVAQHYSTGGGGFVPVQGKDNVYFNGQWVQDFSDKKSPEGLAKYAMSQSSTGATIKEKVETLNKIGRKDAANWLEKNADKFTQSKGNLYTADLPDEMVDRMLDWDKPLSEQSPSVLAALEKSKNKQIRAMLEYAKTPYTSAGIEGETKTMGEAYRTMSMNLSGRASAESAKASNLLQQAGIPGIRYLDAGSRGQGGSGTRNFVVFPGEEKKVKILKRE